MLRSLFTGVAGLRAHQQMLDITSDNIANVNTAGFKSSAAVFETTLSQTLQGAGGAGAANSGVGGTNPMQVGLGVKMAGTEMDMTQGNTEYTGRPSDLSISGDGFFAVNSRGRQLLTRAGSFSLDAAGHLVTPDGSVLQSANGGDLNLSALQSGAYTSWSVAPDGKVNATDATGNVVTLDTVELATVANPAGLERVDGTNFAASANSGPVTAGSAGSGGLGTLTSGYLEQSNVDLSQQLTNLIIAERGFQANSRVISTSDEVLQTLVNLKQ